MKRWKSLRLPRYNLTGDLGIMHLGSMGFSDDIQLEIRLLRIKTQHNHLKNIRITRLNTKQIGVFVDLSSYTSLSLSKDDLIPSADFIDIASAGYSLDPIGLSGLLLDARVWIPTASFLKELTSAKKIDQAHELREISRSRMQFNGDTEETIQERNRRLKKETIESGTYSSKYEKLYKPSRNSIEDISEPVEVTCPKCHGGQIAASNKGFSPKKAGLGTLLFGGIGAVAGFIGSNKTVRVCIRCGHRW